MSLVPQTLNPFNGLLGIPLKALASQIQVVNCIVIFSFVVTGLTTYWLARYCGGGYWPALFTGGAFAFSSYHFAHAAGHMQLISFEWVPLFLVAWLRFLDRPSKAMAVGAALALFLVILCDYYYTFYSVIAGAVLLVHRSAVERSLTWPLQSPRRIPFLVFVIVAGVLVLPLPAALIIQMPRTRWSAPTKRISTAWTSRPVDPGAELVLPPVDRADLVALLGRPGGVRDVSEVDGPSPGSDRVPRLPASRATWRWCLARDCRSVLRLGPRSGTDDPGYAIPGCADAVFRNGADTASTAPVGAPVRMSVMTMLAIGLFACVGIPVLWRRSSRVVRVAWCLLFVFETWPKPLPETRPEFPDHVERLRELPPGGVVGLDRIDRENPGQRCDLLPLSDAFRETDGARLRESSAPISPPPGVSSWLRRYAQADIAPCWIGPGRATYWSTSSTSSWRRGND